MSFGDMGETEQIASRSFVGSLLTAASGQALRWALVPLTAAAIVPMGMVATGTATGVSVAAMLASPLSVLAARSPGERAHGALAQSKHRVPPPDQRRLTEILTNNPAPGVVPGPIADIPVAGPVGEVVPDAFVAEEPVAADFVPGPLPGGYIPGVGPIFAADTIPGTGGGGGGGSTPGTTPIVTPTPTPPVTGSVPEPATWLTLALGFGAIGGGLRSRGQRRTHGGTARLGC